MSLKIFFLINLVILSTVTDGFYNIHIVTLEGIEKPMSDFQGKKIMVIVLPCNRNSADSLYLKKIDSFSRTYADSVAIIGAAAYEYGYQDADFSTDSAYFRNILGQQVTILAGAHVQKSAGVNQNPLFSWLTHDDQNEQFNLDVRGTGEKYFISRDGELYGNLSAAVPLTDSLMVKMLY